MEAKRGKVLVSGLYGLCHWPEIPALHYGEDYYGADLWALNDWSHTLSARFYKPKRIYNLHNNIIATASNLGVDFESHLGKPYDLYLATGTELWLSEPSMRFEHPNAHVYPYEAIKEKLGVGNWFFSSSIAYMIGHALYEGYTDIGLRACSMNNDDEYHWQAIGVLYCCRKAEEMGAHVDFPNRAILEERFKPEDFEYLTHGLDNAPYHVRKSLYRLDKPYHTMDRFEQEECARRAKGHHLTESIA